MKLFQGYSVMKLPPYFKNFIERCFKLCKLLIVANKQFSFTSSVMNG